MKGAQPTPTPVAAALSWIVVMAAAWLAVGSQPWAETLLLAGVGVLYLLFPPSGVFPRSLLALICVLFLLTLTAFLPASWAGTSFQQPFHDHGIELPGTFSPQPWWSLEDITLLFASLLWAWSCLEMKLSIEQRRILIRSYLVGLGLIAINSILRGSSAWQSLPPLLQGAGQFANRNQTGDLLVMGGIFSFALGLSDITKKRLGGIFWMALTLIFMGAIIRNGSRAAVGLFVMGALLSFGFMPKVRRHGWAARATVLIAVIIGILSFAFHDPQLRTRFHDLMAGGLEGRLPIYQDAVAMIVQGPWCGVGLGNFEGVFNIQRIHSTGNMMRCLHPESDWLWLAAELGLGGVIIFALLILMTFRIYLWRTPFRAMTRTSVIVAVLFLIHSFFDVGGHRLGTIWSCLYLVGLGAFRPAWSPADKFPQIVLRFAGLLLLVLAAFRIQSATLQPWMPTRGSVAAVEESLVPQLPLAKQKSLLDRAIGWAPLDWLLYYQRGLVAAHSPEFAAGADDDFNRSLFLEQSSYDLPLTIAMVCQNSDAPETLLAGKELLKRSGYRREVLFEEALWNATNTTTRLQMTTLAEGDPDLETIAVLLQDPSDFDWLSENLLTANPSLEGVSPALANRLFQRWVQVGDVQEFIKDWPLHPEWKTLGWKAYVEALAKVGRFREAVALGLQLLPTPQMPSSAAHENLDEATRQYQDNPQDLFKGIQLYFAQVAAGSNAQALTTLDAVDQLPQRPAYIQYLLAKSLAAAGQSEAAWHALEPLLKD
jgi:O-antigen ligase